MDEHSKPTSTPEVSKNEFVSNDNQPFHVQIGKKYASALAGFVAGALVATIALYPWLAFLGKICEINTK